MSLYVALLARPGARALALACAAGWISFAGLGLALVLLVVHATGSFALAGLCVGAFAAGAALAPLRGRRVDRRGASALVGFGVAHTAAIALLVVAAGRAPDAVTLIAAVAAGALAPPLIATARALWPGVSGPGLTRTGYAANALIGDLAAVLAPVTVGLLAVSAGPGAALALLAGGPLVGCLIIARLGVPRPERVAVSRGAGVLRASPGLRTMVAAGVPLGASLGALEVAAPAVAALDGAPALAAVPLAAFAAGSVACSLWLGGSHRGGGPRGRFVVGCVALAAALVPCAVIRSLWPLAAVLAVAGVGFALINVGAFELLDQVVPRQNAVEALTWLTSAEGLGLAAGGALAGVLAERGAGGALVLVAAAPVAVAWVAVARRGTLGSPDV